MRVVAFHDEQRGRRDRRERVQKPAFRSPAHDLPDLVMELLEGLDLATMLEERGPLPIDEAVAFILQACEAVAEAHAIGIVHRDLKPRNIFVTTSVDGKPLVKVLDFGIS